MKQAGKPPCRKPAVKNDMDENMNRTFTLKHNLTYDITRSVTDMAAFFGFSPARDASLTLKVELAGGIARARLAHGNGAWGGSCGAMGGAGGEALRAVKLAVLDAFTAMTGKEPELAWGILTGVRPGKLAHKLADAGVSFEQMPEYLAARYRLPYAKGRLLAEICRLQKSLLDDGSRSREAGIYIGVPFCPSRCSYCSFPAGIVPADEEYQQNFVNLIEQDLKNVVQLLSMHGLRAISLYLGGGTPTSLGEGPFAALLDAVVRTAPMGQLREFTVEAGRPDCFTPGKLRAMEGAGVTRVSVNPQTFHDRTLRLIGRRHTVEDFYRAYEMVRGSSIGIVNMDLIIGLPGESEEDIAFSLERAAELKPENLTVHTLTLKRGTPLFGSAHGLPPDAAARMTEEAGRTAAAMGMRPYYLYRQHYMLGHLANVGYGLPGTESIYNIQMMEERHPVLGAGPASASKAPLADGHHLKKLNMPKNPEAYRAGLRQLFLKRAALFE